MTHPLDGRGPQSMEVMVGEKRMPSEIAREMLATVSGKIAALRVQEELLLRLLTEIERSANSQIERRGVGL